MKVDPGNLIPTHFEGFWRQVCDIHPVLLAGYIRDGTKIISLLAARLQSQRLGRLNSVFPRRSDRGHDQARGGVPPRRPVQLGRRNSLIPALPDQFRPVSTSPQKTVGGLNSFPTLVDWDWSELVWNWWKES